MHLEKKDGGGDVNPITKTEDPRRIPHAGHSRKSGAARELTPSLVSPNEFNAVRVGSDLAKPQTAKSPPHALELVRPLDSLGTVFSIVQSSSGKAVDRFFRRPCS